MPRSERARKAEAAIRKALKRDGQAPLARAMDVSEATLSRLFTDHIDKAIDAIVLLGFKVVPDDMKCYHPDDIASILRLARQRMEQLESPDQLEWTE